MEICDVKAMREALLKTSDILTEAAHHNLTEEYINGCLALIHAALSTPVRNCDIGTVDEQLERHRLYCIGLCTTHECDYDLEKHDTETCKKCFAKWAQMRRVEK